MIDAQANEFKSAKMRVFRDIQLPFSKFMIKRQRGLRFWRLASSIPARFSFNRDRHSDTLTSITEALMDAAAPPRVQDAPRGSAWRLEPWRESPGRAQSVAESSTAQPRPTARLESRLQSQAAKSLASEYYARGCIVLRSNPCREGPRSRIAALVRSRRRAAHADARTGQYRSGFLRFRAKGLVRPFWARSSQPCESSDRRAGPSVRRVLAKAPERSLNLHRHYDALAFPS